MPTTVLSAEQKSDFLRRGYSRRSFGRIASVLTAGAALPFYNEHALAQMSRMQTIPSGAVKINANENPLGPCAEAVEAIHNIVKDGGRYRFDLSDALADTMAAPLGVKFSKKKSESYIEIFAGSSAPLHQAVLAFCSREQALRESRSGL